MTTSRKTALALMGGLALSGAAAASAQPLGTFRWQPQPYCNVLTLSVVQQGGLYLLYGTDDQCGAPRQASVSGLAFQNPDGTIGFGLTVVTGGGAAIHLDATISVASLNGSWRSSTGTSGSFVFTPGAGIAGPILLPPPLGSPLAESAGGNQAQGLTEADLVVRSVTLLAPVPGLVLATASGNFDFDGGALADAGRCTITTGTTLDFDNLILAAETAVAALHYVPFSGTRGFAVSPGPVTINLVCDEFSGTVSVVDTQLTALFVPSGPLVAMDGHRRYR